MRHYLEILRESMLAKWEKQALSDYKGKDFTFADIATQIVRLHEVFEAVGVKPGDKIALSAKNSAHWAIAFFASVTYRAVAVPLLHEFLPEQTANLVDHSESVVLFTESKNWEVMPKEAMPQLKAAIDLENFKALYAKDIDLEAVIAKAYENTPATIAFEKRQEALSFKTGDMEDLTIINYTSGTTSSPKGVMLTARNISSNVEFALSHIPVKDGDNIISMLPLAHMYGMAFEFIYPICGGGHTYFLGKTPTPTVLMQALADVKPYLLITVPLVMEKIFKGKVMPTLQKPAMRILTAIPGVKNIIYGKVREKLLTTFGGNLRSIVLGGAALNPAVEKVMKAVKLPYTVGYGMTECAPLIGYSPWDSFRKGSCGRIVTDMEVRIDSKNPQQVVGEIQVKGANVMKGYYKNPEATAATFTEDGYLKTGDLGVVDKGGNIFIKGRSKCMILTANGQNIYPEEVECVLNAMPYVAESLVVDRKGKLVALVATTEDKLSKEELAEAMEQNRIALNAQMPAYSKVVQIEILEEGFQHTPKHSIKRFLYE
ncbi:MAG: long-chain fatty acid--CoA ligase [Rikenellaceae bacterium]|nr:long-chain fatty acid--CoA ligase [Rikenellaceae bacterium]